MELNAQVESEENGTETCGVGRPGAEGRPTLVAPRRASSLRQAAAVGRVPIDELINTLRAAVGQEAVDPKDVGETASYFSNQPGWFDKARIVASIDERGIGDNDRMPLVTLNEEATRLQPGEIVELVTTFIPAPGIDIMKQRGFAVWALEETPELIKTYFTKPT